MMMWWWWCCCRKVVEIVGDVVWFHNKIKTCIELYIILLNLFLFRTLFLRLSTEWSGFVRFFVFTLLQQRWNSVRYTPTCVQCNSHYKEETRKSLLKPQTQFEGAAQWSQLSVFFLLLFPFDVCSVVSSRFIILFNLFFSSSLFQLQ